MLRWKCKKRRKRFDQKEGKEYPMAYVFDLNKVLAGMVLLDEMPTEIAEAPKIKEKKRGKVAVMENSRTRELVLRELKRVNLTDYAVQQNVIAAGGPRISLSDVYMVLGTLLEEGIIQRMSNETFAMKKGWK